MRGMDRSCIVKSGHQTLVIPVDDTTTVELVKIMACSEWGIDIPGAYHLECTHPMKSKPIQDSAQIGWIEQLLTFELVCHKGTPWNELESATLSELLTCLTETIVESELLQPSPQRISYTDFARIVNACIGDNGRLCPMEQVEFGMRSVKLTVYPKKGYEIHNLDYLVHRCTVKPRWQVVNAYGGHLRYEFFFEKAEFEMK